MKAFHFPLHALLTLREQKEQTALETYARSLQAERQAREQAEAAERELSRNWSHWQEILKQGTAAENIDRLRLHCVNLQETVNDRQRDWRQAQQVLLEHHQAFLEAKKEREIVEKYRDKLKRQHGLDLQKMEQKMLDDLACARAARGPETPSEPGSSLWN